MNAPFSVRRVTEQDAADMAQLSSELGYPTDRGVMRARLSIVLASDGDLLIAAVDSSNLLEEWAREQGAGLVVVRSNVSRLESHLFYPALGYTISKTQKVYRKFFATEIHG